MISLKLNKNKKNKSIEKVRKKHTEILEPF